MTVANEAEEALRRELLDERQTATALDRVARSMAQELELGRVVQLVTDEATTLTGAQFGAFFYNVTNAEGESYMLYCLSGVPRAAFANFPMPRKTAIFGPTFDGKGAIRLDDVTLHPNYGKNPPYRGMPEGHLPVRSYLAVPVIGKDGTVTGALFFGHEKPGVFTARAEHVASTLAAHAAIALDNARLMAAVRREEQAFRLLIDSIPELAWTARPDGHIDFYNRRWYEYTGTTFEQMQGWGWKQVHHPDHVGAVTERWSRSLETGEPFEMEFPLRGADDVYRWFLTRVQPLRDDAGAIVRWYGTNTNIDRARRQREAQAFLARASAMLTESLNVGKTLGEVANLAVPHIADWCAVDLVTPQGTFNRVAVAHVDPSKVDLAWRLWRERPAQRDDLHGPGRALRTGEPELVPEIQDELLQQGTTTPQQLAILRSLGLWSFMCVPLRARGETIGAVTMVAAESGRRFGSDDMVLAEELARRAASAIDNARLFEATEDARRRAEALAAEVTQQTREVERTLLEERGRRERAEQRCRELERIARETK